MYALYCEMPELIGEITLVPLGSRLKFHRDVGIHERELRRKAVAAEIALIELKLEAFGSLKACIESRNEPGRVVDVEVLDLVLRLAGEKASA